MLFRSPAVHEVFGSDYSRGKVPTDEALVNALLAGSKPCLTRRRLGVLCRWMRTDAKAAAQSVAKRKGGSQ